MLSKRVDDLPAGGEWIFEPKWDGFRALVFRDGKQIEIQSRDEKPLNRYFPELLEALRAQLPARCVLDGEIVIAKDGGLDFEALQLRLHPAASPIHLTPATRESSVASDWFRRFEGAGLDGVMAKPILGTYESNKRVMLKVKHERDCDCVVAGFRWYRNSERT